MKMIYDVKVEHGYSRTLSCWYSDCIRKAFILILSRLLQKCVLSNILVIHVLSAWKNFVSVQCSEIRGLAHPFVDDKSCA